MLAMREQVYHHIAKYATPSDIRGVLEFVGTFGAWIAMFSAPWWCIPLHSLVTLRLFIVGIHDTGHQSLFKTPRLNDYALYITSPVMWMPGMTLWRPGHNYHHRHSNDLDFDQSSQTAPLTVREFRNMSWWKRYLYRSLTRPWIVLTQTAPIGMTLGQLARIVAPQDALLQAGFLVLLLWYGVFVRYVLVTCLSASIGVFLFHLQHTFPECVRVKGRDSFENGYSGSSYLVLPEFFKLFTAGIEYHHIHHLNSRVPSYRLRICHEEAPEGMWSGIRTITLREGWNSMDLVLWSEAKEKLVSFEEVDKEILLT